MPRSLQNIYRELHDDLGVPIPANGDLTPWTKQGVLLLNRVLTVQPGKSGSHAGKGWERVTDQAVRALAARDQPLVAILWGRQAQSLEPLLGDAVCLKSVHPIAAVGQRRLLRLPPVQPGQRAAGRARRQAGRLAAGLAGRPAAGAGAGPSEALISRRDAAALSQHDVVARYYSSSAAAHLENGDGQRATQTAC